MDRNPNPNPNPTTPNPQVFIFAPYHQMLLHLLLSHRRRGPAVFVVVGNGMFDFGLKPVMPLGGGNATMVLVDAKRGVATAVYR